MSRVWLVILLFFSCNLTFSQEREAIIQQRIEFISEQLEDEEVDLTDLFTVLNERFDHPINLNNTTVEELSELNLLTEIQINELFLHIKRFGKFMTIYELQTLQYWDMETISLVLPFVKVTDRFDQLHISLKEAIKRGKFEWYGRYQRIIEQKKGYWAQGDSSLQGTNSYYHGNPDRYYTRFRFSYRTNLSVGITAEKDPGEQFFRGANKQGFDFYSGHIFYKGGKYLRSFAIGDYQIQVGQGLNIWSGHALGKSADVTNVKKSANPLRPYTSVDESRFMRGAALDLGDERLALTLFASHKSVDGSVQYIDTITYSGSDYDSYISSINMSGLHRTTSEIGRKGSLKETIFGGNIRYDYANLHVGLAAVNWRYDKVFDKPMLPYNQFDFRGDNTTSLSADYSYVFRNFLFFGELSYATHSKNIATIHGFLLAFDARASLSVVYRNYQKGYQTFYNSAFAESGRMAKNENGIYAGLKLNLTRSISLNTYVDLFEFPWLKYLVDQPSRGYEFLVQPTYRPTRNLEIYARFRQQMHQKNSRNSDGTITPIEDVVQRNYRINLSYKVSEAITIKSRVEFVTINRPSNMPERGILLTQDLSYKPKNFPVDLTLRYAFFDTDSYDSRLYSFETNALYVYSIPAYYYQGSRAYCLVRWTIFRQLDLWVRYGTFIYNNRKTVGSGLEEVLNHTKSDLTIQLRLKF